MERSPWIFMSAGLQKQAAKINKMFWAGVMSKAVSGRNWKANTVLWICPKPDTECNDMQWYAMICNGLNNCICTHAHTVFEECQVFLKYAYFIMIVMHFLTVFIDIWYFSLHLSIIFYESWLVVVCERIERLGRLGGQVDETGHFSSFSWCSGWVLGTFCRLRTRWQMGDGGVSIPPWSVIIGGNRVDKESMYGQRDKP